MEHTFITQLILPVLMFSVILMTLVLIVLVARKLLSMSGEAQVVINQLAPISVPLGQTLISVLAERDIFVDSACGGKGICGQCQVRVTRGESPLLPSEEQHITATQASRGVRLACMLRVKNNMTVSIPEAMLSAKKLRYKVVSNQLIATYMTQVDLVAVDGSPLNFQPGDYILLEAPAGKIKFSDFDIAEQYVSEWNHHELFSLETDLKQTESRAYSIANSPSENTHIKLIVRIATPPVSAPEGTPAGKVSSYIFSLKPDDVVSITGPFGRFHLQQSNREKLFIGGGAGMAPLRSMIRELLLSRKAQEKISFWYGARTKQQLCYQNEFNALMDAHQNFSWHTALSEPLPSDNWTGYIGFIHSLVLTHYLEQHPAPQNIDYYLCGPPVMSKAVITMLKGLGVDDDAIFIDDFGGGI